jgi:hypothetical protein
MFIILNKYFIVNFTNNLRWLVYFLSNSIKLKIVLCLSDNGDGLCCTEWTKMHVKMKGDSGMDWNNF